MCQLQSGNFVTGHAAHLLPRLGLLQAVGDIRGGHMRALGGVRVRASALETTVSGRLRVEVRGVVGLGRMGKDVEGWGGQWGDLQGRGEGGG